MKIPLFGFLLVRIDFSLVTYLTRLSKMGECSKPANIPII